MTDAELDVLEAVARARVEGSVLALTAEIRRLRAALLGVSAPRQHGPCWCSTLAGLYCVGQPRCRAAREALSL